MKRHVEGDGGVGPQSNRRPRPSDPCARLRGRVNLHGAIDDVGQVRALPGRFGQ